MPATLTTLADILKEFYLGPIQEQLNNEVLCLELFEKVTTDWAGKQVVIPVHLDRNTGVGFSKAGTLPTAGDQGYDQYVVTAENLYGRFQISGDAISAMKSSKGTFAGYVDAEMNKLVNDIRNVANICAVTGGAVIGFIWEDANAASASVAYNGQVENADGTAFALGLNCDAKGISMDDYGDNTGTGGGFGAARTNAISERSVVVAANVTAGEITFAAAQNTSNLSTGGVIAITIDEGFKSAAASTTGIDNEPEGMLGNMCSQVHFTIDRNAAAGSALRSNFRLAENAVQTGGASQGGTLTLDDLQSMLDDIEVASHTTPNLWLMHPALRVSYTSLLQGTNDGNLRVGSEKASHGDGGFTSLGYAAIPMKTSRAVPKGLIFALSTKTWKLCQLQKGGFANLDGNVLSRVANTDAYEGYYRWYYNTICVRPNANGVIVGVAYSA